MWLKNTSNIVFCMYFIIIFTCFIVVKMMVCYTLRKWRVAIKSGVSFSWFLAHCSARGDKASKHSWLISELILNTDVKEQKLHSN